MSIPVRERLKRDRRMLPTGEREPVEVPATPAARATPIVAELTLVSPEKPAT